MTTLHASKTAVARTFIASHPILMPAFILKQREAARRLPLSVLRALRYLRGAGRRAGVAFLTGAFFGSITSAPVMVIMIGLGVKES